MQKLLTTKDLAEALGASESSLRRWTNSGAIGTTRTPGGHRRIPLSEAIRFIRDSRAAVVRPDILGLPDVPAASDASSGPAHADKLYDALVAGDSKTACGFIVAMYLGGMSVAAICDGPARTAMARAGELWNHDCRGIMVEHQATDICIGAVSALRQLLPDPPKDAPLAIGATPPGDPYILPSAMAAAVLVEAGWRGVNFGPHTPLDLLAQAARERGARLVWLSVSSIADAGKLRKEARKLADRLSSADVPLVVGGRCAPELVSARVANAQLMHSMAELSAFARGAVRARE